MVFSKILSKKCFSTTTSKGWYVRIQIYKIDKTFLMCLRPYYPNGFQQWFKPRKIRFLVRGPLRLPPNFQGATQKQESSRDPIFQHRSSLLRCATMGSGTWVMTATKLIHCFPHMDFTWVRNSYFFLSVPEKPPTFNIVLCTVTICSHLKRVKSNFIEELRTHWFAPALSLSHKHI